MGVDVMNTLVDTPSLSLSVVSGLEGVWHMEAEFGRVRKMEGEKVVFGGLRGLREYWGGLL